MVRPAVKKALKYAAEEAYRCGNSRIEPLHLLIASCRLSCLENSTKESALLKDLFRAAGVRPAELAEKLRAEVHEEGKQIKGPIRECTKQLHEVFSAAKEYAAEEGQAGEVCLRHLFESLFVSLCDNAVFKTIIMEAGGDTRNLRKRLGLHSSTIVMQTDEKPLSSENNRRARVVKPAKEIAKPPFPSSSGRRAAASGDIPLPSEAVRDNLVRADEAMRREDWDEAVRLYEKGLEAYPAISSAWNNLGMAYMRLRRFEEAKQSFEKAILFDSGNADAYANLGVLFARDLGKVDDAERYLEEALRLNPQHDCRFYLENLRAMRASEKHTSLRCPPDDRSFRSEGVRLPTEKQILVNDLTAKGKLREALAIYEEFLRSQTHSLQALNNAASLYNRLREPRKACELLKRAIDLDPTYVRAWNNLGAARAMLGDAVGAREAFETSLKHDPDNAVAQQNLQMLPVLGIPLHGDQVRLVPPARYPDKTESLKPSDSFLRRSSSVAEPRPSVLRAGPSLRQLQQAANYELFPKALTRYMYVCIFFGVVDMAVGLMLYKGSWLYLLLAAFGIFLALQGILSKALYLRGGFLREGYILLGLGLICIILFFETAYGDMNRGGSIPWGKLVLLTFLGPLQIRAAFDCFGRHRLFAEMPIKPPSTETSKRLEGIRKEIVNAEPDNNLEVIEFTDRNGRWKAKLEPKVGIFVNVNLGDVLFVGRENITFNQPLPSRPAVLLQMDDKRKIVQITEPSLSRMRRWCTNV